MEIEANIQVSTDEFLKFKKHKNIRPLFIKTFIDCIYSEIDNEEVNLLDNIIKESKNINIKIKNLKLKNLIKINDIEIEINSFLKEKFLELNNTNYKSLIIYYIANPDYPLIDILEDLEKLEYQVKNKTNIWLISTENDFISIDEIILGIIAVI